MASETNPDTAKPAMPDDMTGLLRAGSSIWL